MLVYLVSLAFVVCGLWLGVELLIQIRHGVIDRFLPPLAGRLHLRSEPVRFVIHAGTWAFTALCTTTLGVVFLGDLDPWLLVLPPGTVLAAWGVRHGVVRAGAVAVGAGQPRPGRSHWRDDRLRRDRLGLRRSR